jgi:hypothetical protein
MNKQKNSIRILKTTLIGALFLLPAIPLIAADTTEMNSNAVIAIIEGGYGFASARIINIGEQTVHTIDWSISIETIGSRCPRKFHVVSLGTIDTLEPDFIGKTIDVCVPRGFGRIRITATIQPPDSDRMTGSINAFLLGRLVLVPSANGFSITDP